MRSVFFQAEDGIRAVAVTGVQTCALPICRRAWAITGDGFVLRTTDGRHWSRLGAPHLFRVQFVAARTGFGLTREGAVVRSIDAGHSWSRVATHDLVQS